MFSNALSSRAVPRGESSGAGSSRGPRQPPAPFLRQGGGPLTDSRSHEAFPQRRCVFCSSALGWKGAAAGCDGDRGIGALLVFVTGGGVAQQAVRGQAAT